MLALARRRLGDDADLHVAELGRPLPFPDGAFRRRPEGINDNPRFLCFLFFVLQA
jgi:hypothetical protein